MTQSRGLFSFYPLPPRSSYTRSLLGDAGAQGVSKSMPFELNPLFELAYAANGWVVRRWMPNGECDEYGDTIGTHEVVVFGTDRDVKECLDSVLVHASRRPDTPDKPPKQPSKV